MRNELYEPYKIGADWYFDCKRGRKGPFINEEACMRYAVLAQATEDE
jgi:hypothetical protein